MKMQASTIRSVQCNPTGSHDIALPFYSKDEEVDEVGGGEGKEYS